MRFFYDDKDDKTNEELLQSDEDSREETAGEEASQADQIADAGRTGMSMDDDDEENQEDDDNNNNRKKNDRNKKDDEKSDEDKAKEGQDVADETGKNLETAEGEKGTPSTDTADMTTAKTPKQADGVTPDEDPTASQSSPGTETPGNDAKTFGEGNTGPGSDPMDSMGKGPTEGGSSTEGMPDQMPGTEPLGEGELGPGANPAKLPTEGGAAGGEAAGELTATEAGAAATTEAGGTAVAEAGAGGAVAAEGGAAGGAAAGGAAAGGAAAGGVALVYVGIIILVIIILIGVAGFFLTMPQFLWNKLKEMAVSLWTGFYGYFVGMDEATVNEDDIKAVAQYLHDMGYDLVGMGFANEVKINERDPKTGKLKDDSQAENQILEVEAPYLNAYLVAENRTYMINNYTFNISDAVSSIFKTGQFFNEGVSTWGTGLINLDQSFVDALAMPLKAVRIGEFNVGEFIDGVKVDRSSNTLRIRRLNFDWFDTHNDYTYYNLAGWSGRYGKPFELSLTLHVATMAPDLVKEFCMNEDLDAKVNIKMRNSDINGQVLVDGKTIDELEASGTYDEDTLKSLRRFEGKYVSEIKTKIPYISSVTNHWFRDVYFEGTSSMKAGGGKVGAVDIGVDEDGDDIEDYKEERGPKTQVTKKLSSSDNVYSFGGSTSTGEFAYTGDDGPDVGGSSITISGSYSNGVIQNKDAVRGVTNKTTKKLFQEKYYIYDGTVEKAEQILEARKRNDDSMKEEVKMTKESLSAFSILESSETLDAQYIYRDLKELVIELGYFEREDFQEEKLETLLWPLPTFKRKGWPDRKYEKQIYEYGTLMLCKETVDKIKEYEKAQEEQTTKDMTPTGADHGPQSTSTGSSGGEPGSGNPNGSKVKSQFSPETAAIVEQHLYDFDRYNFNSKLNSYGGFESYCKNQLGGVFSRWTGVDNVADVQTVEEFQEIAEYVWGLMVIYGFDYSNGDPGHYGNWRNSDKLHPDDGFHHDSNPNKTSLPERNIDKICNGSQGVDKVVVNCNWGADYLMFKCGIFSNEDPSKPTSSCAYVSLVNDYGGQIITNKEDLKPGDLIQCFRSKLTDLSNPSTWGSHEWFHVCTVGEVDEAADTITIYDAGHYFTESGNYKHVIKRSGDYFPYEGWAAIRVTDLADEGLIGFPPDKEVIAMAKGTIKQLYHEGENTFTQSYLSTLVYGQDLVEEEDWEFAASEQTDEGVRIKITEGPIKGYELIIFGFDVDDSVYEGMEVEAETVIGKTIKSNMCFILIDKEKSIVDNVEDYVRKPENEEKLRSKDDFDVSDEANFVQNPATFIKMFQGYDKIIANTTAFMDMQRKYHVSAAFAACVTIAESSGGTNWSAISESTHNWFSIKGDYNGQSQGGWRSYPSYAAAVDDFGDLIANSSNYYKAGKHTVNQIGPTYCSSEWSKTVNDLMKKAYDKANAR